MSDRMDAIRTKFAALPFDRQIEVLDSFDALMAEAEARLVYSVWVDGEKMPGPCSYSQLRVNFNALADGLEDDGDELTICIVAVAIDD